MNYFSSPTFWTLFFGSFLSTAFLTPFVMKLARRVGAVDHGGYRKIYEGAMPLMGGLAIAAPFVVVCVLAMIGPTGHAWRSRPRANETRSAGHWLRRNCGRRHD